MDKFWWLVLGLLIGWVAHWIFNLLFCKCKCTNENCSKHGNPAQSNNYIPTGTSSTLTGAAAGVTSFKTKDGQDDLQVIEGIGPKISVLLNDAGIHRFSELASTPIATLENILKEAGPHFHLANPSTWPEQAALIAKGDITGFERLVAELKGGVRT